MLASEGPEVDRFCAGGGTGTCFRGDNRRWRLSTLNRTAYSHLLQKNGRSTDLKNTSFAPATGSSLAKQVTLLAKERQSSGLELAT